MTQKTKDQTWADWVATKDVGHFQKRLTAETEDGKFEILSQLLSKELGKLKKAPPH